MRIGVMTGGGDSSGINDCLCAIVRRAESATHQVVGIMRGWAGLLEGQFMPLTSESVEGIQHTGGTILRTSRTNLFNIEGGPEQALAGLRSQGLDTLIAIGGDDTLGVAHRLCALGAPAVGIPQTIDNDIGETDYSIGFDTAVTSTVDSIWRMHSTNYSHQADMLVEVMGRDAGWIAVMAAIAGGAHYLCIPEVPLDLDDLAARLEQRRAGPGYSLVVISEGVALAEASTQGREIDAFGHLKAGGISETAAELLKQRTGRQPRVVILSYTQRGGAPSAFDSVLGVRMGMEAVDLVGQGRFDRMVCSRGGEITSVPLEAALARNRTVPLELYQLAQGYCR